MYLFAAVWSYRSAPYIRADPFASGTLLWMAILGIGSTLFHGTMRYSLELLDEGPMLGLMACTLLAKTMSVGYLPILNSDAKRAVASLAVLGMCGGSFFAYIVNEDYQFFCNGFTAIVLIDTVAALCTPYESWAQRWCLLVSIATILVGKVAWQIDDSLCEQFPRVWPLHVAWHVLSCGTIFYGHLHVFMRRAELGLAGRGAPLDLSWASPLVPYTEIRRPLAGRAETWMNSPAAGLLNRVARSTREKAKSKRDAAQPRKSASSPAASPGRMTTTPAVRRSPSPAARAKASPSKPRGRSSSPKGLRAHFTPKRMGRAQ